MRSAGMPPTPTSCRSSSRATARLGRSPASEPPGAGGPGRSDPGPLGAGVVADAAVGGADQALAALVEAGAAAVPVHRVAERHPRPRVGEAERAADARVPERLLGVDHALVGPEPAVVDRLDEPG